VVNRVDPAGAIRRLLLILVIAGAIGMAADLILLEHYEDGWQLVPFAVLGAATVSAALCIIAPRHAPIRLFRLVMVFVAAGGLMGLWLHYQGNMEFEREVSPGLAGFDLFWNAVKGASPPSLAPASLIHLGLLGLASTYRHPSLAKSVSKEE
jgi:hypothetical protein